MANVELFQGQIYKFRKEGTSLVLSGASDNSDETKIFRKGLIVSGSFPLDIKPDSSTRGLRLFAHNANTEVASLETYATDDCLLDLKRGGVTAFQINTYDANTYTMYMKSAHSSNSYDIMDVRNSDNLKVFKIEGGGRIETYGGDFRVHGADDANDYTRIHTIGNNHYIDYKNSGTGFLQIREDSTMRAQFGDDTIRFDSSNFEIQSNGALVVYAHNIGNNTTYAGQFLNRYNSTSARGLHVSCGTDGATGTNYAIVFTDGDGTWKGAISFSGDTVTYGAFTGVHEAKILSNESDTSSVIEAQNSDKVYPTGTIVSNVISTISGSNQPDTLIVSSSLHQDKRVMGVYFDNMWSGDDEQTERKNYHNIASIGDGVVLVNNQNGNIENGDYITTASGSGGYGCKQNDDLLHNYTVAKSLEDVDWSTEVSSSKLIACTYHCG